MQHDTRPAIDMRSVGVALVVLLVGAALGFGVGYKYEKQTKTTKTQPVAAVSHPSTPRPTTDIAKGQPPRLAYFLRCMAAKGVHYTSIDISKPPPDIGPQTYKWYVAFCYQQTVWHVKG